MPEQDRNWTVYWDEHASGVYLYGSELEFHARDDVEFRNALMPAGTVIKSWYSMVNFQERRVEPSLPIIDGEGRYHVSLDIDSDVPQGIFLRFVFHGKNGDEAGSLVMDQPEMDLRCPLKTYSYEAQLICAGAHSFRFHSFTITERDPE
jgi:accessory secretory protein Asp3